MAASQRHTLNYIREVFAINGCELLSADYISNKDKLKFKCNCGAISEISFAKFQAGQRCRNCKGIRISEKISGPNNPHWRLDLTAEQRTKERTIPGYNEWRRAVFERDNYTCVACEERGRTLNAHHLESYARVPEKRTDLDNGVTLCRECHTEYHSKILHNDADHDSFTFFLTEYREPWYAGEDVCDG